MKIFLATNNGGKIERFKRLLREVNSKTEVFSPRDLNIAVQDVEETGTTLEENALLKAKAYVGKVDMPILANDTGFYAEGEGFVDTPKRKALEGVEEKALTKDELSEKLLRFWQSIATKHGGKVDAAWIETFVVIHPGGEIKKAESRREVILTDKMHGMAHRHMPVRALYISKATNKPSLLQTEEEEITEMQPIIAALRKVI